MYNPQFKELFFKCLMADDDCFKRLKTSSLAGVLFWSGSPNAHYWMDDALTEQLNFSPADLKNRPFVSLFSSGCDHHTDFKENEYVKVAFRARGGTAIQLLGRLFKIPLDGETFHVVLLEMTEEREEHFRLIAEHSGELICQHLPDGTYHYVSPSILPLLGYRQEELIGKNPYDFIHPDDAKKVLESSHKDVLSGKITNSISYRLRKKDGRYSWFDANSSPVMGEKGEPLFIITTSRLIDDRKEAEQTLLESQQMLEDIAEHVPGVVMQYQLNPDGNDAIKFVSKAVETLWEVPSEKAYADISLIWKKIHPDDLEDLQVSVQTSYETMKAWYHEYRAIMDDGRIKWIAGAGIPRKLENGSILWNSLGLDITPQKVVEQKLMENVQQLNLAIETADLGIWTLDLEQQKLDWNERLLELYGIDQDEFDQDPDTWQKCVHPADLDFADREFEKTYQGEKVKGVQLRIIQRNTGEIKNIISSGAPVFDEKGNLYKIVGVNIDISDLIKAQEEAEEREMQYLNLTNSVPGAVLKYRMKADGTDDLLFISEAAKSIWGVPSEKAINDINQLWDVTVKEDLPAMHASILRSKEMEELWNHEWRIRMGDGSLKWLNGRGVPRSHADGSTVWDSLIFDITDYVMAKEKVLSQKEELETLLTTTTEQNERLKEYSYITSHNIRSSVSRISGLVYLLQEEGFSADYLIKLEKATESLDLTIANINELLYLEKDIHALEKRTYDLNKSIHRIIEQNSHLILSKKANLCLNIEAGLAFKTIPAYIDSIIQNLLTNTLKYGITPVSKENGQLLIVMKDDGMGIDLEKFQHKMFKLGSRFHSVSVGHGLGLYMTKRQVESLNGTVEVISKEYQGSTFKVMIPLVD